MNQAFVADVVRVIAALAERCVVVTGVVIQVDTLSAVEGRLQHFLSGNAKRPILSKVTFSEIGTFSPE